MEIAFSGFRNAMISFLTPHFRAVADQVQGNPEAYDNFRQFTVDFICAHREDFEPFIEDDVPFDKVCTELAVVPEFSDPPKKNPSRSTLWKCERTPFGEAILNCKQ